MVDALQKLINAAKEKLDQEKVGKRRINSDDYRKFLENLANKKCPTCGRELNLLKADIINRDNAESVSYEFTCGHKHSEIHFSETIKIWESLKGKMRRESSKPHLTFLTRSEPGKNSKSVDGVSVSWSADRENNKWKHMIKDIKTGKILHQESGPLNEHKKL